ncbi:MAG: PD-(D/E)XK nuclease family protein [Opitutaceae bacterium]|nr:PD-(D/E)XK nuclease family protein [Opitutaceae bacterium]
MPPAVRFRRHFLSWDRPWLPQVTAWLAREWTGAGPLDLSDLLAVVPTQQAARRLREALAEFAGRRGSAVFPPRAVTPDALLAQGAGAPDVASRLEALLAWAEVLRTVDLDTVADVFPVAPPRRDASWAWSQAEQLFRLQTQLTEGGLAFMDVPRVAGPDFPEAARWRQLAELERLQAGVLAARGRREPHAARRDFARAPALPAGVRRVAVLAVADPLPLALDVLATWAAQVPVESIVFAPATEAEVFDAAGRPLPEPWARRAIDLPHFERRVRLLADPAAEAGEIVRRVTRYADPDGLVALGVADPEVMPLLENDLSRAGQPHYNPEGAPWRTDRLHALLGALAALARDPAYEAVATLARCPDFLLGLQERFGPEFSVAQFLAELDDLRAGHLPADLADARRFVRPDATHAVRGLELMAELRTALQRDGFPAGAVAALTALLGSRSYDRSVPADSRAIAAAEVWREVMRQCEAARELFPGGETGDWWDIALRLFGDSRQSEEKEAGALELQGWLELPWEDAPHLMVAGLNDGLVPDAIVGDAFLPESLRVSLGLKTNAARYARDAYLLQALAASRRDGGRLELLFAKHSAAGDPLRPSRLLLACADPDLPARISQVFRPVEALRPNLAWTRAWRLAPRREPAPTRVPVTGLRAWLACPFRFYLAHVLKMRAVDPAKNEMDAFDFGTLCHAALEELGRDPVMRDCTDEALLREFLLAGFERALRARYGKNLPLPLVVQAESARQRLSKVAAVQARERAEGWRIERIESAITLELGGLVVRGRIDRIDRHEATGAWRVLDYKTSDTAVPPSRSHLRPARPADAGLPAWRRISVDGRECVWVDLQLPVYLRALGQELAGAPAITGGYFNLPKAAGETGLALWPELSGGLLAAARACTDGVAGCIRAGEFWPPAELEPDFDDFAALVHHGVADSFEWEVAP